MYVFQAGFKTAPLQLAKSSFGDFIPFNCDQVVHKGEVTPCKGRIPKTGRFGFDEICSLVGGFNPFEKYYSSQIGNLPKIGIEIKTCLKPPTCSVLVYPARTWLINSLDSPTIHKSAHL